MPSVCPLSWNHHFYLKGSKQCLERGWIGVSKNFHVISKSNVSDSRKSQRFGPELSAARSFDANSQEFRYLREFHYKCQKWTLSARYLTTPLSSGKMKCWGCSFDAERSPLRRSSPNPKKSFGERRNNKTKYDSTNHNNKKHGGTQEFIPRFGNPTKELLRPRCWGDHKGQSLFHLLASLKATTKVTDHQEQASD